MKANNILQRIMTILFRITALTLFLCGIAGAAHAEDLLQIYQMAVTNDPSLKSFEANNQAAHESLNRSFANFLPKIGVSGGYTDTTTDSTNDVTTVIRDPITGDIISSATRGVTTQRSNNSTFYSVDLNQPLYNRSYPLLYSQNKKFIAQSDADMLTARQDLIFRVANAYFAVLGALDNLDFSEAEQKAIGRQLDQTKQRFDVGLVAITDVHEAQARYDTAVARGIEAQNALNDKIEALRAITGKYHETLAPLAEETPLLRPEPDDIDQWTKAALEQNLAIQSQQQVVEQLRDSVRLQRADYFPTIGFNARHGSSEDANGYSSDSTSFSVNLSLELYSGGRTKSGVRQSLFDLQQSQELLEERRRSTQQNVRSAFLGITSGVSRVKAFKQALLSSESRLRASEAGFEVGTRTTVDVLDARQDLFGAERDYARSRYEYILNTLRLKLASGQLSDSDIALVNTWLK
jgi:outer membrane protein